jgi:hypothetical protein
MNSAKPFRGSRIFADRFGQRRRYRALHKNDKLYVIAQDYGTSNDDLVSFDLARRLESEGSGWDVTVFNRMSESCRPFVYRNRSYLEYAEEVGGIVSTSSMWSILLFELVKPADGVFRRWWSYPHLKDVPGNDIEDYFAASYPVAYRKLLQISRSYNFSDTFRVAPISDALANRVYETVRRGGCCGSCDDVIKTADGIFRIGFNYGH